MKKSNEIEKYKKHYDEKEFLGKVFKYAKTAGINVVYVGLLLFYTLQNPKLPRKLKNVVIGSLGYFILPIDLVPDMIPLAGYTDDLGILMAAIVMVAFYIDEDAKTKAKEKLKDLFGEYDEKLLEEINKKINKSKQKEN
ncbi:YkvA family protein [Tissierella creatinophila]|uniref:DUF1232 domain-containing protein n=1 Tax=Tissierella creatinophila DSM 6911 TaxID=1123403 RepID=A0A1U7M933_TISCR|nr:YkvA family protein [Tissierella creatinophila]OLS03822.1 hypothetical protein TICRE_01450 [Tissierella creatinophila DSM 6911]